MQIFLLCLAIVAVYFVTIVWKNVRVLDHLDRQRLAAEGHDCTYKKKVAIRELDGWTAPPWSAFPYGLEEPFAHEVVDFTPAHGHLFAADFHAAGKDRDDDPSECFSIVCARLDSQAAIALVTPLVAAMAPSNGLRVVMRKDCVYALFGPSYRRDCKMSAEEKIIVMQGMSYLMMHGDTATARRYFERIPGHAGATPVIHAVVLIVPLAWIVYVLATFPIHDAVGALFGTAVVLAFFWGGMASALFRMFELRMYLECRSL